MSRSAARPPAGAPARRAAALLACVLLPALAGCVTSRAAIVRETRPDAAYGRLYPRSIEVCATSQIRSKFAGPGGSAGHAVLFLQGVCRDRAAGYPRVRLCGPESDPADDASGTGVSVDRVLRNVNWVAVPGERLFFYGEIGRYDLLERRHLEAAAQRAAALGVFDGVEIHGEDGGAGAGAAGAPAQSALLEHFVGTDLALAYGRSAYCVRFPVTEAALARVVDYLNGLNARYADGGREYRWSGIFDNCAHVLHNALAAAGLWAPQSVRRFVALQFLDLAIPVDQFSKAALLLDLGVEDPVQVYASPALRRLLLEEGWLPLGHGALFRVIPVHQRNAMYETDLTFFSLGDVLGLRGHRVAQLVADARFTDVEYNLLSFRRRYQALLERRERRRPDEPADDAGYERFRAAYFSWVERQRADVEAKLEQLYAGR